MMIKRIRFDDQLYIVRFSVTSGFLPDPWGDDPGSPDEVNIQSITPTPTRREVWDYCQGWLESDLEIHADHAEDCKADCDRTGRFNW